jgi:hypothetical protein
MPPAPSLQSLFSSQHRIVPVSSKGETGQHCVQRTIVQIRSWRSDDFLATHCSQPHWPPQGW